MEWVIISMVIIFSGVIIFLQSKKFALVEEKLALQQRDMEKKLESLVKELHEANKNVTQELSESHKQSYGEWMKEKELEWGKVKEALFQHHERRHELLEKRILSQLNTYLQEEEEDIKKWVALVEENKGEAATTIPIIESALNKYPSSRMLMNLFQEHISFLLTAENVVIRKHAIERYNRAARVFIDNCKATDWSYAKQVLEDALKLGNMYINETETKRVAKLKDTLNVLEQKIVKVGNSSVTEGELLEIEKLDGQIDKKLLGNYPELLQRYQHISKKLLAYFSAEQTDEEKWKQYNLRAVQAFKDAYQLFLANEKTYKKGININSILSNLGGWEAKYFYPSTQVYFQAVYSEIFAKLDPDVKPVFSSKMITEGKKEIG